MLQFVNHMKNTVLRAIACAGLLLILAGPASAQLNTGITYQSTGKVACTRVGTQDQFTCDYGIVRLASGQAEIHILSPTGHVRKFLYTTDTIRMPEESEAQLESVKNGDTWTVTLNKRERYTIPDSAFTGG
jgi:hypothetical protein